MMIKHRKITFGSGSVVFTDNVQCNAEHVNRQEVTADWYLTIGLDNDIQLWAWIDGQYEYGLDPWRMIDGPEDMPTARYFVQKNQIP
jgi:hypothetical protein